MEHFRKSNKDGSITQLVDAELCVVMDMVTGELKRFARGAAMGNFEEALEYVKQYPFAGRNVIVRLNCVRQMTI
jgi:hypothetical protein